MSPANRSVSARWHLNVLDINSLLDIRAQDKKLGLHNNSFSPIFSKKFGCDETVGNTDKI